MEIEKNFSNYSEIVYDYLEEVFDSKDEKELDLNVLKEMIRCCKSWERMRVVMFLAKKFAEKQENIKIIPEVL